VRLELFNVNHACFHPLPFSFKQYAKKTTEAFFMGQSPNQEALEYQFLLKY
jgi:hypothetical protein